jgi:hypothetical protein
MLSSLSALLLPLLQASVPAAMQSAPAQGAQARHAQIAGDSIRLGDGFVRSWVELDERGAPTAIGVTLPDVVVRSAPAEGAMLSLDFPAIEGLPFLHVLFDWVSMGHPPAALYAHPHWDAHFYLITAAERRAIVQGATSLQPDARYMPPGFLPVPELGLYAFPEMGVHWMHEHAPELHGRTFDQTIIYGSIGDRTIFVEPMFTSAFLETQPDFAAAIPQPEAVAASGWYPARYVIRYVAVEHAYRISLEAFRWRGAAVSHARIRFRPTRLAGLCAHTVGGGGEVPLVNDRAGPCRSPAASIGYGFRCRPR